MNEMIYIGKTVSTFGIKGELKVISDFEKCDKAYKIGNKILINNIEHVISGIRYHKNYILLEIDDLKNIEKYEKNINYILKRMELSKERELDNFYINTSDIINKYYNTDLTTDEEINILKNITCNNLKEFVSRLNLKVLYVLEGDI